jgi:hypothetical protein
MKEWEHHIAKEFNMSYCGVPLLAEWFFVDAEHACSCVKNQSRLQPCPECMKQLTTR